MPVKWVVTIFNYVFTNIFTSRSLQLEGAGISKDLLWEETRKAIVITLRLKGAQY